MIVESYEDVIRLSGALRSNFWDTIHTAISLTLRKYPRGVILDCSRITECTPNGAETFQDALNYIRRHGSRFIVAEVPPQMLEVLKTVPEVRSQLPIASTIEEARKSMDLSLEERAANLTAKGNPHVSLLALYGTECDEAALEFFADEVEEHGQTPHLVAVIEVPRELPLQAPLTDKEEAAHAALETAKSRLKARRLSAAVHMEKARDLAAGIAAVADKTRAEWVFVPLPCKPEHTDKALQVMRTLLHRLTCRVVLVRGRVHAE